MSLLANYRFNWDANDSSWNWYNATVSWPTYVQWKFWQGADYDGSTVGTEQIYNSSVPYNGTKVWSMECLVKINVLASGWGWQATFLNIWQADAWNNVSVELYYTTADNLLKVGDLVQFVSRIVVINDSVALTTWVRYHLMVAWNWANRKLFKNWKLVGTSSSANTSNITNSWVWMWNETTISWAWIDGVLDECKFYSDEKSNAYIKNRYAYINWFI